MSVGSPFDRLRTLGDRIRRPEYTGENRCTPCTVVNLVVALLGTTLLATVALPVALGFLVLSVALIYVRGYLVPGTPTLTERYLPDRVLALFDHHPSQPAAAHADGDEEVDLERLLRGADAVTDAPGDDLQLTPAFRREWYERIARLREREPDRDALAPVLGTDIDAVSFQDHGDAFVAYIDDVHAGQWESGAAFFADVAGGDLLAERSSEWAHLSVAQRSAVLGGLRLFLDRCPACGGPTTLGTDTVESCCRSVDVVAVSCEDCDSRLFEESYEAVLD